MKYNVIYTKRRSLSITVSQDNVITVRCPKDTTNSYIDDVLERKRGWIEKIAVRNSENLMRNADVYSYKNIFLYGEIVPLYIGAARNCICEHGVYVKSVKHLKKLFNDEFSLGFYTRVKEISEATGLKFKSCNFKNYKSRWGCCTGENEIFFNFRLFMLPQDIVDYVIVHELCHTRHHNHSIRFWQLVSRVVPDYVAIRKKLKDYNFLTTLY